LLIEDRQVIGAPRERLWDFLMQVEKVGECMPGCDNVRPIGNDEYDTTMKLKVGPIALKIDARLRVVARDRDAWTAKMRVEGTERGVGGGVSAMLIMVLVAESSTSTALMLTTDAKVFGKLGEFGQPVMKKKAASMTEEFARTIGERMSWDDPGSPRAAEVAGV
jgi:carbon monoxide dehydrogenase subunit G